MIPPEMLQRIMSIEGQIAAPEAELLYERARQATVCIVEIGSFRGRSTIALALGSKAGNNVPVYAIDPHEQTGEGEYPYGPDDRVAWMRNVLDAGVADIVRPINLPSRVLIDSEYSCVTEIKYDLLFIDGDHDGEAPSNDLFGFADPFWGNPRVLMHDRHAEGVQKAVEYLDVSQWNIIEGPGSMLEIWRK